MAFERIDFEVRDQVGHLTLNVPEKLNPLSTAMLTEIKQVLDDLPASGARALLITGAGRGFCSGADLTDASAMGGTPPDLKRTLDAFYHPVIEALHELDIPIITAVNGVCAGAGTGLALTGDLIVAETTTRFNLGFVKIGLMPDAGSTWALPRRIGLGRAMEMALLGDEISGETALDWGLINRAVEPGTLGEAAKDLATKLANGPTLALGLTRKTLNQSLQNSLSKQLETEGQAQQKAGRSEDFAAGIMSFFTKKPPEFKGK